MTMATIMSDYAPTVVRRIDAGEVERLYFLAVLDPFPVLREQ